MAEIENDNIVKTMKLHIKVAKDDVQKLICLSALIFAVSAHRRIRSYLI